MSSVQKDKQNLKKRMEQSVHEAFSVSRKPLKSYAWLDPIFFGRNQRRLLKHTPIYILKVTQKYIFLVFGILINKVTLPPSHHYIANAIPTNSSSRRDFIRLLFYFPSRAFETRCHNRAHDYRKITRTNVHRLKWKQSSFFISMAKWTDIQLLFGL